MLHDQALGVMSMQPAEARGLFGHPRPPSSSAAPIDAMTPKLAIDASMAQGARPVRSVLVRGADRHREPQVGDRRGFSTR